MSQAFWKRLSHIFGLFALAAVFGFAYFSTHLEIKDLDLWLHIGMGRYIVAHDFQIPAVDVLSCTIPGKPWNNHEWLFQILVFYIQKIWGFEGLINMQVILIMATLSILFIIGYNPEKQLGSIFALLLVVLVYQIRFTTRPDLFSLFFFAIYIWMMSHFLKKRWSVYVLFAVQVLWTNIHGFFFFGPLFVLIGLIAEWTKRHIPLPWEWNKTARLDDDEYRRLRWIFLFVVLACFFNPQTIQGAIYPVKVFFQLSGESKIFFENIVELKKPILRENIFSPDEYPYYKLLILLSFMSLIYNRRKIDIGVLLFWVIFLFFSLAAIRNIVFFAFAAYLVFVTNSMTIRMKDLVPLRIRDPRFLDMIGIFIKFYLIFWTLRLGMDLSYNGYYNLDTFERKSEYGGVSLRSFPTKAVDFLVQNKVKGNFLNDFNSGAYLVGRCSPNIKVFIDGRTEVYGPQFFKSYKSILNDAKGLGEAVERYNITGAFLHTNRSPVPPAVLNYFANSPDWVPVYFDYDAVIFVKNIPENQGLIKRFRIDWAKWSPLPADLKKIGSRNIPIFSYINRSYTLQTMNYDDLALAELEEARKINPGAGEIYKHLGKIYAKKKNYPKAFETFRLAVVFSPDDESLRFDLAMSYFEIGEYAYAAQQLRRVLEMNPNNLKAHFLLAKARVKQKLYAGGLTALKQALALDKNAVKDVLDVADLMVAQQSYEDALRAYDLVIGCGSRQEEVHLKRGIAYRKMGNVPKAIGEFRQGLKIMPGHPDLLRNLNELKSAPSPRGKKAVAPSGR